MNTGSIENVEREIDKVLYKLRELSKHREQTFSELIQQIENYSRDLSTLIRE